MEWVERTHYVCEDSFYSCPLAEGGCCDSRYLENLCNCGADAFNKEADKHVVMKDHVRSSLTS